jgi:uncharacterized membrane protein YfcA
MVAPVPEARIWTVLATGLVAGVLSGLLGVGGGILMVPAMVLFLGFSQHQAHATSLAAIVPIALVASVSYAVAGETSYLAAALLAPTSMLGANLGARLMPRLDEVALRRVFGLVMMAVAVRMFL